MTLENIKTIGILGGGQMGRGIAQVCAAAGYRVLLVDVSNQVLEEAGRKIRASFEGAVERAMLSRDEANAAEGRIHPMTDWDRFEEAELVIEAIQEIASLKHKAFVRLGGLCRRDAILASNTSSISIGRLAAGTAGRERVIGMHFMNPAPVMRLVEVVRSDDTSAETVATVLDLVRRLGKTAVVTQDVPGFIVNRILMPMINEAVYALDAGVGSAEDIDLAMTAGANHPVGPLALADRIGLDTVLAICDVLSRDLQDFKFRPCPLLRRYVEAGRLGRKSGRGFYTYEAKGQRHEALTRTV